MPSEAHDWSQVVALIGPHPDLTFDGPSQAWVKVRVCDKVTMSIATPATVDALMMQHATAWLDERSPYDIMRIGPGHFKIIWTGHKPELGEDENIRMIWAAPDTVFTARLSATIAAVVAAAGERGAEG